MSKKPLDPAEGLEIVRERMAHRGVKIRYHHESWWGTLIGKLAYKIFGKAFPKRNDPTGHDWIIVQTVGNTIWLPSNWEQASLAVRFEILLHEERHTFQFEKYGLGSMTFGILTMGFLYLCCLPVFWTMRAKFEQEAYYQSMRARFLLGDPISQSFVEFMQDTFCSRNYVWMMGPWAKKKVEKWTWRSAVLAQNEAKNGCP